jgi:hypothetical protein
VTGAQGYILLGLMAAAALLLWFLDRFIGPGGPGGELMRHPGNHQSLMRWRNAHQAATGHPGPMRVQLAGDDRLLEGDAHFTFTDDTVAFWIGGTIVATANLPRYASDYTLSDDSMRLVFDGVKNRLTVYGADGKERAHMQPFLVERPHHG